MKLLIVLYGQDWYDFSSDPYIEAVHSTFTPSRVQKYISNAQKRVDEQALPWAMVLMVDLSVEKGGTPTTTVLFSKHNTVKEKFELNKEAKKVSPKKTPYMWDFLVDPYAGLNAGGPQGGNFVNINNELVVAQGQLDVALAEPDEEELEEDDEDEDD